MDGNGCQFPAAGQMYMKTLMVIDGKNASVTRMIVQPPGSGPMEMPVQGMMGGVQQPAATDVRETAERVGAETVTTPAGTVQLRALPRQRRKLGRLDLSAGHPLGLGQVHTKGYDHDGRRG